MLPKRVQENFRNKMETFIVTNFVRVQLDVFIEFKTMQNNFPGWQSPVVGHPIASANLVQLKSLLDDHRGRDRTVCFNVGMKRTNINLTKVLIFILF